MQACRSTNRALWSDYLRIGDEFIDAQHKTLFGLLQKLTDAVERGDCTGATGEALSRMFDYTQRHFYDEEALMARIGYPGIQRHKIQHSDLLHRVEDLMMRHQGGEMVLTSEVVSFLRDWLVIHIANEDQLLKSHL